MSRRRILVVEDDVNIRRGLVDTLEGEGYQVAQAADGRQALAAAGREAVDLILLDIMMPECNGLEVCRELRGRGVASPIIFLTAKGEEIDKVLGLQLGADDYITKPFGVRELLARIDAVLRRCQPKAPVDTAAPLPDCFPFGARTVDRKRYRLKGRGGTVALTARELKVLEVFYTRPDEVLSRDDLLNAVWGIDYHGTTRTLDQHIAQLRKKVEHDPANPRVILTVHGVGYRYCHDPGIKSHFDFHVGRATPGR